MNCAPSLPVGVLILGPASTAVDQMCARLLANPVIETYRFEVEEG